MWRAHTENDREVNDEKNKIQQVEFASPERGRRGSGHVVISWWCVRVLGRPATKGATEGFESRVMASLPIDYIESGSL